MNDDNSYSRPRTSIRSRLFIYCLILSLLLHVLGVLTLPLIKPAEYPPQRNEPTFVRLVDGSAAKRPEPAEKQQSEPEPEPEPETEEKPVYEVDPLPAKPKPQQPVETFRKADRDQLVEKEQAPEGEDSRDETTARPISQPQRAPSIEPAPQLTEPLVEQKDIVPPPAPELLPEKEIEKATVPKSQPETDAPITTEAEPKQQVDPSPDQQQQTPQTQIPQLTPQQLLPNANTLDQIARGKLGDRNRVKEREDVEIGDTVWLNLQNDMLVSFFRRFRDRVERVWNYPAEAAQKGLEGTLELLIIVNKDGELIDVIPQQSSGSDILDMEAIKAIYAAAPFGPLTRHYPHEQLRIRAYFRYHLTGRYIYGR